MGQEEATPRRHVKVRPGGEGLEARQMLTGGAGSVYAIIAGEVTAPGGQADVPTTLDAHGFTLPRNTAMLGIDVAPAGGSAIQPKIQSVTASGGGPARGMIRSVYSPFVKDEQVVTNAPTSAVLVPVTLQATDDAPALDLVTRVSGQEGTSGKVLVGYYLPGDVSGDGKVDDTDLAAIQGSLGTVAGQSGYHFDADANRDGRISALDLAIANYNKGVETRIQPVVSANLNPISDSGTPDRRTVYRDVVFDGEASAGARITFAEVDGKVPETSTVVGPTGKYRLIVSLAEGPNTFRVTSHDTFGQTISGTIAPVEYLKPMVPVESPMPAPDPATAPGAPTPAESGGRPPSPYEALKARFPNAFQKMSPDQAENLRIKLESLQQRPGPKGRP